MNATTQVRWYEILLPALLMAVVIGGVGWCRHDTIEAGKRECVGALKAATDIRDTLHLVQIRPDCLRYSR